MEKEQNVCWEPISNFSDISNVNEADFNHWSEKMYKNDYILSYKPSYEEFIQCENTTPLTTIHRHKFVHHFNGYKYINIWNQKPIDWKIDEICKQILIHIHEKFTLSAINNDHILDNFEIEIEVQCKFGKVIKDQYLLTINQYIQKVNTLLDQYKFFKVKKNQNNRISRILNEYIMAIKNLV